MEFVTSKPSRRMYFIPQSGLVTAEIKAARGQAGVNICYEAFLVCSAYYSGSQKGFENWILLRCSYFAGPCLVLPQFPRYFRHFFQLAAHNDDQFSVWWHWPEGFGAQNIIMLRPSHHSAFPAKITQTDPRSSLLVTSLGRIPKLEQVYPTKFPEIWCRRTTKVKCSKTQKVELDFRGKRRGAGNTPGTDLPVVAGPSLADYKVIIDQLPRLPRLGLGEVTSN